MTTLAAVGAALRAPLRTGGPHHGLQGALGADPPQPAAGRPAPPGGPGRRASPRLAPRGLPGPHLRGGQPGLRPGRGGRRGAGASRGPGAGRLRPSRPRRHLLHHRHRHRHPVHRRAAGQPARLAPRHPPHPHVRAGLRRGRGGGRPGRRLPGGAARRGRRARDRPLLADPAAARSQHPEPHRQRPLRRRRGGVVAVGVEQADAASGPRVVASRSVFYPDTGVMGWAVEDSASASCCPRTCPGWSWTTSGTSTPSSRSTTSRGRTSAPGCATPAAQGADGLRAGLERPRGLQLTWTASPRSGPLSSSVLFVLRTPCGTVPGARLVGLLLAMGPGLLELVLLRGEMSTSLLVYLGLLAATAVGRLVGSASTSGTRRGAGRAAESSRARATTPSWWCSTPASSSPAPRRSSSSTAPSSRRSGCR